MSVCPVCNAFQHVKKNCPHCHSQMKDKGRVADYYGPYSHYTEFDDQFISSGDENVCHHIISCPSCEYDEIKIISEHTF